MNYCENCHFATEQNYCPNCGKKKLRQVAQDDFCFILEKDRAYCDGLIEIFKESGVTCSAVPFGSGVESQFGLPLKNYRLFVPFNSLKKAQNLVHDLEIAETEELRQALLENINLFNIPQKNEKKLRKKVKLPDRDDFIDFCVSIVKTSEKIVDGGIAFYGKGHYLFCYAREITLTINSMTFEILSLEIKKRSL